MAERYPSSQILLQLCSTDQTDADSCTSSSCSDLHMCRDYLLTNECSQFQRTGQCTRSHSLFTRHNQRVIKETLNISPSDTNAFEIVSKHVEQSRPLMRSSIRVDYRPPKSSDQPTSSGRIGRDSAFIASPRLELLQNSAKLHNSDSSNSRKSLDIDQIRRAHVDQDNSTARHSLAIFSSYDNDDRSSFSHEKHAKVKNSHHPASIAQGMLSRVKHVIHAGGDPSKRSDDDRQLKYLFSRYSQNEEFAFLHGPAMDQLAGRCSIFSSGYCRFTDPNQEKDIQDRIRGILPVRLNATPVPIPKNDWALFICSSAVEEILEQNQTTCAFITEPDRVSCSIEVKHMRRDSHARSASVPATRILSPRSTDDQPRTPSSKTDRKLHISVTNSSIDVIEDDITAVEVDLMVCVTTSKTLLHSILAKAGPSIEAQFQPYYTTLTPIILPGGHTQARKILFAPWKLTTERWDSIRDKQSLITFVKQCVDKAKRSDLQSIAFPSIGTGELGLDPGEVSQIMINAAHEILQEYRMNVVFVIYPSTGNDANGQSYRAFQNYLDELRSRNGRSREVDIPIGRSQTIQRSRDGKRLLIISDSNDVAPDYRQLMKSIHKSFVEKPFDLSLVDSSYQNQVELLINICLNYHLLPRMDFSKNELILRGDESSCSQCLMNLRNLRRFFDYSISKRIDHKTLNMHVSMKIDEALGNQESMIVIKDGEKDVYRVDLQNYTIHINDDRIPYKFFQTQLNVNEKIIRPKLWSSSLLIRTTDRSTAMSHLHEYQRFQRTMPASEWRVDQIEAIENWPLYVRYSLAKKDAEEDFAFYSCAYSSVQSIIHYGLHSNSRSSSEQSMYLTPDAFSSHVQNARRSSDGRYYMFVVQLPKKLFKQDSLGFSNETAHLVRPMYLIVYQRETIL